MTVGPEPPEPDDMTAPATDGPVRRGVGELHAGYPVRMDDEESERKTPATNRSGIMSAGDQLREYWTTGDGGRPLDDPEQLPELMTDSLRWCVLPYLIAVPVAMLAGVAVAWLELVLGLV